MAVEMKMAAPTKMSAPTEMSAPTDLGSKSVSFDSSVWVLNYDFSDLYNFF